MKYIFNSLGGGRYCSKGRMPHEVIDFFKADDGWYYGYIAPYGTANKWCGEKRNVILFLSLGNKKLQLVAKFPDSEKTEILPTYNKHVIKDIFEDNNQKQEHYVTFRCKQFCVPKTPTQIDWKYKNKRINCQKLYTYFDEYKDCCKWEEKDPKFIFNKNDSRVNLLQTIKSETNENIVSNLLCYFLKSLNKDDKRQMLSKLLKYKFIDIDTDLEIKREEVLRIKNKKYGRADLYIQTKKEIIIIENKILSPLEDRQINKYEEYIRNANKNGKVYSLVPDFYSINTKYTNQIKYSQINIDGIKTECDEIVIQVLKRELAFLSQKYLMDYFKESYFKFKEIIEKSKPLIK